jgi:hypothetical protein
VENGATSAQFDVTTASPAQSVTWSADDEQTGTATPAAGNTDGTQWTVTWPLTATDGDGTHVVTVQAFLLTAGGIPKQVSVNLNRFIPGFVQGAGGGIDTRKGDTGAAAINWTRSTDNDVLGYTVYRAQAPYSGPKLTTGGSPPGADTPVCSTASQSATFCMDTSNHLDNIADGSAVCPTGAAPGDRCLDYYVVPHDQLWASGNPTSYDSTACPGTPWPTAIAIPSPPNSVPPVTGNANWSTARDGCPSAFIAIDYTTGSTRPQPPAPTAAAPPCSTSSDGFPVINWTAPGTVEASYRIYRDSGNPPAYDDPATTINFGTINTVTSFKDPNPPGAGNHIYYVTTVDDHFQESAPLAIPWTAGTCP